MQKPSPFTFEVEPNLSRGAQYGKLDSSALSQAWGTCGSAVEAMSAQPENTIRVFTEKNLFAEAVNMAFYEHHPLILSPDVIWLTIAQGLANHVSQNAETLRSKFVDHEGKLELVVERPSFVKGSPQNDWESVFPDFAAQIAKHSGQDLVSRIECDFSTTTTVTRVASHITLMDTVQHYYEYVMLCGCGFPAITLTGTPTDWERVRAKAEELRQYDLDWWIDALLPVLDQFVTAANGEPDLPFWRSLCNLYGASGMVGDPITGWLQVFFPYLNGRKESWRRSEDSGEIPSMQRNSGLAEYMKSYQSGVNAANFTHDYQNNCGMGIRLKDIPAGLASAPFTYQDLLTRTAYKMRFMAGVASLVQHADGSLEPSVGWAVLDQ